MSDPRYPALYQINTRVWLTELVARARQARDTSTTFRMPNWTAWPRWASTGSGC